MHEGLIVYRTGAHTLMGLRAGGAWQALRAHHDAAEGALGNVYRGRVVRVVPGMQAAFVDIGLRRTAFLHAQDASVKPPAAQGGQRPCRIEEAVRLHEAVLVQVRKEALADKGARVTRQIALSGRTLVLLPLARHLALSQRIEAPERRLALRTLLSPVLAQGCGLVVRTAAADASDTALLAEFDSLQHGWRALVAQFEAAKKPGLLSVAVEPAVQLAVELLESLPTQPAELLCNDAAFGQRIADAAQERGRTVHVVAGPEVHRGRKQADKFGFFAALRAALGRKVPLAGGGSLGIDECEALTAIDVNSGTFVGERCLDATVLAVNLQAAQEVARQLTLRGIGGIVVVDFIDTKAAKARHEVAAALRDALAQAPGKSFVSNMSELGLVQLTRRRTQPSLRDSMTTPCGHCGGRGRVRAPWQVAAEALDAAAHALRQEPAPQVVLNLAPEVAEVLWNEAAADVLALEQRHACTVLPVARQHFARERVEVLHGGRLGSVAAFTCDF